MADTLKVRYEIDPYNRIVRRASGAKGGLNRLRLVYDGRFKLDENNELSYRVKAPASGRAEAPNEIRIKGSWSLTPSCDLRLTLDKESRDTFGDSVTLQGDIVGAGGGSLAFAVTTRSKDNIRSTYILDLKGYWKADSRNRISFFVKRESDNYDVLTLGGAWEIGRDHQIVYTYEKAQLIRKRRSAHTLTFKGTWMIKECLGISYVLSGSTDSEFDFKTSAGVFREGYIRFEIGAGLSRRTLPEYRVITFYGRWNMKQGIGLVFEVDKARGVKSGQTRFVFGADAKLTGNDTVSLRLKSGEGRADIGATLELSRAVFKGDGAVFLRALASRGEYAVYAGGGWRW